MPTASSPDAEAPDSPHPPQRPNPAAAFAAGAILTVMMPPRPAHLAAVRTHIQTWLTGLAVADTTAHDIVTATDEALTNAVNHNHDTLTGLVALTIEATPTTITTTITSNGTWTSSTTKPSDAPQLH